MPRSDLPPAVAGIAVTVAAAAFTTHYIFVRSRDKKNEKEFSTYEDLEIFGKEGWQGMAARTFLSPFISVVKINDRDADIVDGLSLRLSSLSWLREINLSSNNLSVFPNVITELRNLKKLNLSRNQISRISLEIKNLDKLEELDLGHNKLIELPPEIGSLKSLRFLNLMSNCLTELPEEIGNLTLLYRLGLKSNQLKYLPSSIGNMIGIVELFLTDNHLEELPKEMGKLKNLFKLQASFNRLQSLPEEMGYLPNLELMRVAVNQISSIPLSFSSLDKLSWFSLAGNPSCPPLLSPPESNSPPKVLIDDIKLEVKLGDGASGDVFAADLNGQTVAVKIFKAETSPDGHSNDEIAISSAIDHPNLIRVLAIMDDPKALVMKYLAGKAMADKPNFSSLLRCRWKVGQEFAIDFVIRVCSCICSALNYLHSMNICHGDVYAHNVIVNDDGFAVLCDYGASFCYSSEGSIPYEAHEVRAFGLMFCDLVKRLQQQQQTVSSSTLELELKSELQILAHSCVNTPAISRPKFEAVLNSLNAISEKLV